MYWLLLNTEVLLLSSIRIIQVTASPYSYKHDAKPAASIIVMTEKSVFFLVMWRSGRAPTLDQHRQLRPRRQLLE